MKLPTPSGEFSPLGDNPNRKRGFYRKIQSATRQNGITQRVCRGTAERSRRKCFPTAQQFPMLITRRE